MKDYSQYGEQEILLSHFENISSGTLVDIGAADGITNSNSKKLIELGWKAFLIEPGKKNYEKLVNLHSNNQNVKLFRIGLGDENIKNSIFYTDKNDEYEQISTFSKEQYIWCEDYFKCDFVKDEVDLVSSNDFFEENNLFHVNFISIDAEGYDSKIIKNLNLEKIKIDLICVENIDDESIKFLENNNYKLVYTTTGNKFYEKK